MSQTRSRSKGTAAGAAGGSLPLGGELSPPEPGVQMPAGPHARGRAHTKKTRVRVLLDFQHAVRRQPPIGLAGACCMPAWPRWLHAAVHQPLSFMLPLPALAWAHHLALSNPASCPTLLVAAVPCLPQIVEQTTQEQELPGGDQVEIRQVRCPRLACSAHRLNTRSAAWRMRCLSPQGCCPAVPNPHETSNAFAWANRTTSTRAGRCRRW